MRIIYIYLQLLDKGLYALKISWLWLKVNFHIVIYADNLIFASDSLLKYIIRCLTIKFICLTTSKRDHYILFIFNILKKLYFLLRIVVFVATIYLVKNILTKKTKCFNNIFQIKTNHIKGLIQLNPLDSMST